MSTPAEEVTVDLDAIPGGEVAERSQTLPDGTRQTADDVKIEVETAPEPKKEPKKAAAPVLTPDEGLEKLKKQLEDEKSARIAAENRERAAAEDAARARNETQGTQLDLVKGVIASVTATNDALEEKYGQMLAAQDYAGAAKVQREMSANEAKLVDLQRGQKALESAPKVAPRAAEDPVEALAAKLSPKSAAWVRAHPEYAREKRKFDKMIAADMMARADGFEGDTPEYFAAVEETLGISHPRQEVRLDDDPTLEAARPSTSRPSRQTAPPSAPVSRSGNGTGGSRPNVVTLSAEQVEIAKMMQMTPEEYAKQVIALKKEGKLN